MARLVALSCVLAMAVVPGGGLEAAGPDPAGRVDGIFAAYDRPDSPGCALGVIKDGAFLHLRGYGMANLEHAIPIGPRTVFDIGSTSKQFTAAAVVLLAQDGKLSLDDDIRKHVPELPDYGRPLTIRHLLHHTSGLRDYLGLMSLAGWNFEDVSDDDDALRIIARQKELNFEPGAEWLYSNSGFFLLSVIVKRASGQSLRQFAAERIFRPLGMTDTHFHDDHTQIVPRRATGYSPHTDGGFQIEMSNFEQTGDGSVYTTLQDLLQWDRNFYEAGVGGRALIEQLTMPGRLRDGQALHYGLGLSVDTHHGFKRVSHGGSWAGYRAELMRFPEQRLSVACLCNVATASPTRLATQVAEIYLGHFFPGAAAADESSPKAKDSPAEVTVSAAELQSLVGAYRDAVTGLVRRVSLREGKLVLQAFGSSYELRPVGRRTFQVVDGPMDMEVAFEEGPGGARLRETSPPRPPRLLEAVAVVNPSIAELGAYAGRYYSEELDTVYALTVEEGKLVVRGRREPSGALTPSVRDEFAMGPMSFRFRRGREGTVAGFLLGQGRIRNLRFERRTGPE